MLSKKYSRPKKSLWPAVSFVGGIFLIYFLGSLVLSSLAGPVGLAARPAWWIGQGLFAGSQSLIDFFRDRNHLAADNRRLSADRERLLAQLALKNQISAENNYLRELFGRFETDQRPIAGEVIFLPNFVPDQILTVDLGLNNLVRPIKVGDWAVAAGGSVIIGRVVSVDAWSSKIKLLSAEKNLPVMIGDNRLAGIAVGAGAGNFTIVLPRDASVKVGDSVVASTFDSLLLGVVRHLEREGDEPNQTLLVKVPLNLWQLKWLEIYEPKI
ncbi:MAG: hypothetical protein COV08_02110 [Candidatus Vogelbacteria bacterium CG10_big_fil_rev_8_21_14_0_10_49_38]|uniref:Cell shape-determining protein MreC n=1 Tax=Candidatus Vogelbacteria bacterium CG10_big_fil_rev_8_21_14_0_10_49_38 TaxID=1975043 RepID=A0A2H0RJN0_9BACT|nr:MAG: hypothetical protein BK006_02130 [bacterium CG10_49_38]PIR45985.1 MAG: hypothetical protein COV08_02110 [Candidatus Vogelbacteria bacterium CG10_big_fil_rev_8_21_14_0_10_49_38]